MDVNRRTFAERALKHMFIGSQLDGVKFGVGKESILIRFMHYTNREPDDLWLNIESRWTVFPSEVKEYPDSEDDIQELTEEEQYNLIFNMRRDRVVDVKVGDTSPHLQILFKSGRTLFVNGHHDKYECWQGGDGAGYAGEEWLIVAVPGDRIVTQTPDDFSQGRSS